MRTGKRMEGNETKNKSLSRLIPGTVAPQFLASMFIDLTLGQFAVPIQRRFSHARNAFKLRVGYRAVIRLSANTSQPGWFTPNWVVHAVSYPASTTKSRTASFQSPNG